MILGDFNLRDFDWNNLSINISKPFRTFTKFLVSMHPIYQLVNFPTRGDKTLDIILSNNQNILKHLYMAPPIKNSDHICITGHLSLAVSIPSNSMIYKKDYFHMELNLINQFLKLNYLRFGESKNSDSYYTIFNSLIDSIKSNYVPEKRYHVYKNEIYPHYIFKLYKKFSKHYKKYKLTNNSFHLLQYKILKKKFSTKLKKRRQLQEVDLVVNKNFKKFFKYFNA